MCWHWENLLRHKKSCKGWNTRCNKIEVFFHHFNILTRKGLFWMFACFCFTMYELRENPMMGSHLGYSSPRRDYLYEWILQVKKKKKEEKKKAGYSWLLFLLAKNSNGLTILLFMVTRTTLFEKSLISMIAVDMFSSTEQFRRKKLFY